MIIKGTKIYLDDKVVQNPDLIVSNMNGEKVMLSITKGKYYNLGKMGGLIWELLQNPITVNQLIKKLISEFDVDEESCQKDVINFLDDLLTEEIIKVVNS